MQYRIPGENIEGIESQHTLYTQTYYLTLSLALAF